MLRVVATLALLVFGPHELHAAEERIELETRSGVRQPFLFLRHTEPRATLMMFEGGSGTLFEGPNPGFVTYSRSLFHRKGFSVATFLPPSDRKGDMRGKEQFRLSARHRQDVEVMMDWLKKQSSAPIWLVGMSLGTQSVAGIGTKSKGPIDGIVFLSSKTAGQGTKVLETDLAAINVPTLVVHHKRDGCDPVSHAHQIVKALKNSRRADIREFDGGASPGREPCSPGTYHTYHGIQESVVDAVAEFIARAGS